MPQFMMMRKNAVEVPAECPDDACVCILAIVPVPVCTPPSITNFLRCIYRCHSRVPALVVITLTAAWPHDTSMHSGRCPYLTYLAWGHKKNICVPKYNRFESTKMFFSFLHQIGIEFNQCGLQQDGSQTSENKRKDPSTTKISYDPLVIHSAMVQRLNDEQVCTYLL